MASEVRPRPSLSFAYDDGVMLGSVYIKRGISPKTYISITITGAITSTPTIPTNIHPTYLTNIIWILPSSGINDDGIRYSVFTYKKEFILWAMLIYGE